MIFKSRFFNLMAKFFLFILSIFISFLILELGFRLLDRKDTISPVKQIMVANERGDTLHSPNLDIMYPSSEQNRLVHIKTNSDGFVGFDYPLEKSSNTLRLAMLGDSFIEAFQVDFESNFVYLLERNLRKKYGGEEKIEVMNFGVGGQGTMEELLRYEYYIKKYQPDFIFVFFFPNDLENNQYYLSSRELILKNNYQWKDIKLSNANNNVARKDFKFKLINNFRVVRYLDDLVRKNALLSRLAVKLGLQHAGIMGLPRNGIHPAFFMYQSPLPTNQKIIYDFTADIIKFFKERALENNTKLVIIYLPEAVQTNDLLWQEKQRVLPALNDSEWDINQPNNFLKEVAEKNAIYFFDLTPVFSAYYSQNSQNSLYNNKEGHFNEEGHRLTANALVNFVTSTLLEKFF